MESSQTLGLFPLESGSATPQPQPLQGPPPLRLQVTSRLSVPRHSRPVLRERAPVFAHAVPPQGLTTRLSPHLSSTCQSPFWGLLVPLPWPCTDFPSWVSMLSFFFPDSGPLRRGPDGVVFPGAPASHSQSPRVCWRASVAYGEGSGPGTGKCEARWPSSVPGEAGRQVDGQS